MKNKQQYFIQMNKEKQLKHISNFELLNELTRRYKSQIITRKELLQLSSINWCLECGLNREIKVNGYCGDCNNNWLKLTTNE